MTNIIIGLIIIGVGGIIGGILIHKGRSQLTEKNTKEITGKIDSTQIKDSTERKTIAIEANNERKAIESSASLERKNINSQQLKILTEIQNRLKDYSEKERKILFEEEIQKELGFTSNQVKEILESIISNSSSLEDLGLAFYNMQDYSKAVTHLFDAFRKHPNQLKQHSLYSLLISSINTDDKFVIVTLVAIVNNFTQEHFFTINRDVLQILAYHAHLLGKNIIAEKFIKRAIELEPDNTETYFIRGAIQFGSFKYKEAISNLKYNLDNGQTNIEQSLILLINSYKSLDDFELASKFANQGMKEYPNNYKFHYLQGTLYIDLSNEPEKGIPFLNKALSIEKNTQILFAKSLAFLKSNQLNNALKAINQAIQLNSNEAESYNLRGQIYSGLGRSEDVEKDRLKFNSLINKH